MDVAYLKNLAGVVAIVATWLGMFSLGVAMSRRVAECPDFTVAKGSQSVIVPELPSGDTRGGKCVTIRGYFVGPPGEWRYVGMPKGE